MLVRASAALVMAVAITGCRRGGELPPRVVFDTLRQDLGVIPVAPEGRHVVYGISNRGGSPLRITKLVVSCGCLHAVSSKGVLGPGEAGTITVLIAPVRSEESMTSVSVHTNDPTAPVSKLNVSWRSRSPLDISPEEVDFGTVLPGQVTSTEISLLRAASCDRKCEAASIDLYPADRLSAVWGLQNPAPRRWRGSG